MGKILYYFAYGSNMAQARLKARVPSARLHDVGKLEGYRLAFHKVGMDGSAKCDACRTGDPAHTVYGVVFTIDAAEKHFLDKAEGLGNGYEEVRIPVGKVNGGNFIEAFTYTATHIDPLRKPFDWYREFVLHGARENGLPATYIAQIEAIAAIADDDESRAAANREILTSPSRYAGR